MVNKLKGKSWPLERPLPKSRLVFSCTFDSGNLGDLSVVRDPSPGGSKLRAHSINAHGVAVVSAALLTSM